MKYGARDRHQPGQALAWIIGLLTGCLIIFVFLFSLQSWRDKKAEAVEALFNVMALESQAIDSYLTSLENNLKIVARDLGSLETADALAQGYVHIQHFHELHPELYNITVFRADGQILFTAKNPPAPDLPTLAQEPSFMEFKKESGKSQAMIIGRPIVGKITKQWIIPFRYPLRDDDGSFHHVLSANLPLSFLQGFWKEAPFTRKAALGLVRDDGYLVGRYPVPDQLDYAVIYGQPRSGTLMNHLWEQHFPSKGYVEGTSKIDGPEILSSYLRLEHFPLTLFIALPLAEIRSAWWDTVRMSYILAVAMLAIGIIFYFYSIAQEAKKKSSQLYHSIFEQSRAVNLLIDPATAKIVDANEAACAFYGYARERLLGMRITDINTLSSQQVQAEMASAKSESRGFFLFKHRLASGEIRDVEVHSNPLDIEGRTLLYSIIHDITDRLLAEHELEESKRQYDEMVARVPVGIFRLRIAHSGSKKFEYVSPRFCEILKMKEDAIRDDSQLAYARIHPDDLPRLLEADEAARKHPGKFSWQGRAVIDGQIRIIQIESTSRSVGNGDLLWTGILTDITERKQTEMALQASESELVEAQRIGHIGSWTWDAETDTGTASDELLRIYGFDPATQTIPRFSDQRGLWYPPEEWDRLDAAVQQSYRTGISYDMQIQALRNGQLIWVQTRGEAVRDCAGQITGLHGTVQDITERKKIEEELQKLNEELEARVEQRTFELQNVQQQYLHAEKLSAIGKLSASIAHEFNNPLQSVMTVMKGLKKTAGLEGGDLQMLELAIGESERMKKLIGSLRDFNRPSPDRKCAVDMHKSIEAILTLLKSDLGKKNISLTCEFLPNLPQILAIPDQIKQVLLNLLTNAMDACRSGGEIEISTHQEGNRVAVAIKDTGVGIPAENMEHIFRPFFTTKAEVKGTGLGLPVSYGIVKKHNGEIRVESEPGKGATFTILLPINSEENALPARHPA